MCPCGTTDSLHWLLSNSDSNHCIVSWYHPPTIVVAVIRHFLSSIPPILEYDFLACFCALLPTFRFSSLSFLTFFLHPGMFIFFVSFRLCSSHLLLWASTYFIVHVLSACVSCTLPHLGILLFFCSFFFFFVALISRVFFCCALVPGTLALGLATLILWRRLFFLFHCSCDHRICISLGWRIRKDTGGTADVVG